MERKGFSGLSLVVGVFTIKILFFLLLLLLFWRHVFLLFFNTWPISWVFFYIFVVINLCMWGKKSKEVNIFIYLFSSMSWITTCVILCPSGVCICQTVFLQTIYFCMCVAVCLPIHFPWCVKCWIISCLISLGHGQSPLHWQVMEPRTSGRLEKRRR